MFFQVVVEAQKDTPKRGQKEASADVEVRLDLKEEDVVEAFVDKYKMGEPIIINGRTVYPGSLRRLQIWQNALSSSQVRAEYEKHQESMARQGILSFSGINHIGIAKSGTDVTDTYLKGPPGYGKDVAKLRGSAAVESRMDPAGSRIFLVHGHDDSARETVARFLERLGLEVIILHEQPNHGRTIIEKFEKYSDVSFAVVLLTADDKGCSVRDEAAGLNLRARQNVVFELGFFIGKLGRERVCALHKGTLELPSDYSGIVYVSMDGSWKLDLAKEIKQIIPRIDMNKAL